MLLVTYLNRSSFQVIFTVFELNLFLRFLKILFSLLPILTELLLSLTRDLIIIELFDDLILRFNLLVL